MNILIVFGTRPEAIKMAPLIEALHEHPMMEPSVCATFQHDDMLKQVLDLLKIKTKYNLDLMTENQTITQITNRVLIGMEGVLSQEKPDLVLVHGDTSTTLAASLATFYAGIPLGHVEAGLRSYGKYSPFPEEMNRRLTDHIADYYFAPTSHNMDCLIAEGCKKENIHITGNTVVDVILKTVKSNYTHPVLTKTKGKKRLFVTVHRRESFGEPIQRIMKALLGILKLHEEIVILFPVHPNPNVQMLAKRELSNNERIYLLPPLNVFDCHNIMAACELILTDSGGIQEEAPSLGIPTLVLRTKTDRPEIVNAGMSELVGDYEDDIIQTAHKWLENKPLWFKKNKANLYGDGKASQRITEAIAYHFGFVSNPPEPFTGGIDA